MTYERSKCACRASAFGTCASALRHGVARRSRPIPSGLSAKLRFACGLRHCLRIAGLMPCVCRAASPHGTLRALAHHLRCCAARSGTTSFRAFAHCCAMRYRASALRIADFVRDFPRASRDNCLRQLRYGARRDVPKRTRTSDLQVRNLTLYPTELWAQNGTEREGFEPSVPERVQLLSREPDSATLAPLHCYNRCGFSHTASGAALRLPALGVARRSRPIPSSLSRQLLRNCAAASGTERVGFEPTEPYRGSTVFKTASFDHSDISPDYSVERISTIFSTFSFVNATRACGPRRKVTSHL